MRNRLEIPTYDTMMNPLLQALRELGESGTIQEIDRKVIEIMELSEDQTSVLHNPQKGSQSEIEYRLAWTRTYLKKYGLLDNSKRGVWSLTQKGTETPMVDPHEVVKYVREVTQAEKASEVEDVEDDEPNKWQDQLLQALLAMPPDAFERLTQRLLREAGFIQVEVTGRSGDGGVDGKGIMRLGGMLSFRVIFQCKRYQGSVTASQVRDFRGAMIGRADKGIIFTTGSYTQSALNEATRDGAPTIDLIDGEKLVELLKDLELGVKTRTVEVEEISVDHDWFSHI